MRRTFDPSRLLLVSIAAWLKQQQRDAIGYLRQASRVLTVQRLFGPPQAAPNQHVTPTQPLFFPLPPARSQPFHPPQPHENKRSAPKIRPVPLARRGILIPERRHGLAAPRYTMQHFSTTLSLSNLSPVQAGQSLPSR